MAAGGARATAAEHARQARHVLAGALSGLQSRAHVGTEVGAALAHAANASSALYRAEAESTTDEATTAGIQIAVDELGHGLRLLNALHAGDPELEPPLTALARALALLYPIASASVRQRRDVHFSIPPPPESLGRRGKTEHFAGRERRAPADPRVVLEVDIGFLSESNFYSGISLDVSLGGLFVCTYQPSPPGTLVSLYFVLPGGRSVQAEGVVRWLRAASDDCAPGMGVAFKSLSAADARAIAEFCASRPPLYYEE